MEQLTLEEAKNKVAQKFGYKNLADLLDESISNQDSFSKIEGVLLQIYREAYDLLKESRLQPEFKKGDKITLNTGYNCDIGFVIADYGNVVFWEHRDGSRYCSPRETYKITLQKA